MKITIDGLELKEPETVAFTQVGNTEVSTVRITGRLDSTNGVLPYETCVFRSEGGMLDSAVTGRYATEVEALRGHIATIKKELDRSSN